jgi:hypothetical protein
VPGSGRTRNLLASRVATTAAAFVGMAVIAAVARGIDSDA